MEIELRVQKSSLAIAKLLTFPKSAKHKPFTKNEYKIMYMEPQGVFNTGETGVEFIVPNAIWI